MDDSAKKADLTRQDSAVPHAPKAPAGPQETQPVRAISEDDDGYDPYTDWHDRRTNEPLFEADPWN